MSLATTAQSIEQHTKDAYMALRNGGVTLPEKMNLVNLASTINDFFHPPTGEFGLLKRAMQDGTYLQKFPLGAEIDDTDPLSDNQINPWRIVDYGEYNLADGGVAFGAVLLRKYAANTTMDFKPQETTSAYYYWLSSPIRAFLNSNYLGQCSPALQASVSKITIKSGSSSSPVVGDDVIWLPSVSQYNGNAGGRFPDSGSPFSYFSTYIGSPTSGASSYRVIKRLDTKEAAYFCYTRDGSGAGGHPWGIYLDGSIVQRDGSNSIVPACFIAADS